MVREEISAQETPTGATAAQAGKEDKELAAEMLQYFGFKGMRYTDVSKEPARSVFNLGADHGFPLFDGLDGIAFFGWFHRLEIPAIVARVRFLLNNIRLAYTRVEQSSTEQKLAAIKLRKQIRIEILVPDSIPIDQLKAKVSQFQPTKQPVSLIMNTRGDVKATIQREYDAMKL